MGCGSSKNAKVEPRQPAGTGSGDQNWKRATGYKRRIVDVENRDSVAQKAKTRHDEKTRSVKSIHGILFRVIREGVYVADMQEMIGLKNQNYALEEEIRVALSKSNMPPPPIDAKESQNPRRFPPPRNPQRENASILALEVDTIFDIVAKNTYSKNKGKEDGLRKREKELNEQLKRIQ